MKTKLNKARLFVVALLATIVALPGAYAQNPAEGAITAELGNLETSVGNIVVAAAVIMAIILGARLFMKAARSVM